MAAAEQIGHSEFAIAFPALRAEQDEAGEIILEGIASDEGLDLENEIVKASGWVSGLEYLREHGKVNWDHDREHPIGEVEDARIVDADWAEKRFGVRPVGRALYVRLRLWVPNEEMPEKQQENLRRARGMALAGARLGLSMEGVRTSSAIEQVSGVPVVNTARALPIGVAVTPHPVNPRTAARLLRIAKSLSELFSGAGEERTVMDVLICKGIEPLPRRRDGGVDVCVCPRCGARVPHERGQPCTEQVCPECGTHLAGAQAKGLEETVERARRMAEEYEPGEREGPEKEDLERMARALDAAIARAQFEPDGQGRLLRTARAVAKRLRQIVATRVHKGVLEAGGGLDASQFTGGRALQCESIEGQLHTVAPGGELVQTRRRRRMTGREIAALLRSVARKAAKAARRTKRGKSHWAEAVARGAKPGEGERFEALAQDIAKRGGVRNPEAVAAAIGRRKYGKEAFQRMAAEGRRRK